MKKILLISTLFLISSGLFAQDFNITFQVDMSVQIKTGNFDPAADVVKCVGNVYTAAEWSPADSPAMETSDDSIYTVTYAIPAGDYEYKYVIGSEWGRDELQGLSNRTLTVSANAVLDVVQFDNKTADGQQATITFNVDMVLPMLQGNVDPTTPVYVAGSFTDWQNSPFTLEDADGDSVYSGTFTQDYAGNAIVGGNELYFKFIYGDLTSLSWESVSDRYLFVVDGEQEFTDYWNSEEPTAELATGNILFNVDMSVMSEVGLFDDAVDSLHLRSSFNGWSSSVPENSQLNQDFLNTDEWYISVLFENEAVATDHFFKYFIVTQDTLKGHTNAYVDPYERPLSQGGGNRDVTFNGDELLELSPFYYDDVLPGYVVPEGQSIEITFNVDMTVAADADQQVPTFNSATDTVWWVCEQPAFVWTQDWEDTDNMKVLMLEDSDGDMIYSGTLTVNGPSWNGFEYRYAFTQDGSFNHEPGGYGDFAYRVRYVGQDGDRSFVQPYSAPTDTWSTVEDKSDQSELHPDGYTDVREVEQIANSFKLEQNYPNPFNPTTLIKFNIPSDNKVVVKVFNLVGEEVSTLVNSELSSGSYEVKFNASNLSSGIYFYSIQAGNYSQTKKMMLLK